MNELKIYREVMCHDNEEWSKIWGGIDLPFQNWHEEFDELWLEYSAVSKIFTVLGSFWTKFIMFELKQYRRVIFMTLKSDPKFEEKLTCGLENDVMNLVTFYQSIRKSQIWDFDGILLSEVKNDWA